jgi:acyl carrier protein
MNESEFIEFFKKQLIDETTSVSLQTSLRDIPDWDSLSAMLLISNLIDDYQIEISATELQNCTTLFDIYTLIGLK